MLAAHLISLLSALIQVSATQPPLVQQATAQADSGSRVRITVEKPSKRSYVGMLVSADADSLRFTTDTSGVVAVPTASIARLERSRGRRSNAGRGAVIGGVIGGAAGLLLGIAASAEEGSWYEVGAEDVAVATVFLGATFAGLGALIGATSKRERWEPVYTP